MNCFKSIYLVFILIIGFLFHSLTNAEITIEPFGFAVSIEEDDETVIELVLSNSGEDDVGFNINSQLIEDDNDRREGPRRDDPGDILEEYEAQQYRSNTGLAWDDDNNWMWGFDYEVHHFYAFDPEEEEIVENFDVGQSRYSMFYLDGVLYIGAYANDPNNIFCYDTEGNALDPIRSPISLQDGIIASDGELLFIISGRQSGSVHIYNLEDLDEVGVIDCSDVVGDVIVYSFHWVNEHPDGQLWLCCEGHMFQCYIDDEWNCDEVVDFDTPEQPHLGISHDGDNLWIGMYGSNQLWVLDDGVQELYMLSLDPQTGIIPGDDSEVIEITIVSEGYEAGVYNILIEIELAEPEEERDDFEDTIIQISAIVSLESSVADIAGAITDAADDDPIENVFIELDRYIISVYSDDEGNYTLSDLPVGEYELTYSATDYLSAIEAVNLEDDDVDLNIALLHSECTPSEDEFFMALNPDFNHTFEFGVFNGGTGPLTYQIERRLANEDANVDPWELREIQDTEEIVEDNQLNGVTAIDGQFYVSGGNNRNDVNKIYVLSQEGEIIRDFNQFHESDYGMRDLCYDGELIWGSDAGVIYGFDTEGELVSEIEGDAGSYRSLTYDTDNDLFISADITSDIYISDRNGELVRTIDRPDGLRMYGLAYWSDDPDGYNLYVFNRGEETDIMINKVNLENGDLIAVNEIDMGGGRPGGICVTNQLDVYSWVFIGMVQNPDRIAVWQLAARRDWFQIEPEAGESEDFFLTLDATDLPPDNTFEGILIYHHDGVGRRTEISVRLDVIEGEVHTTRELDLLLGWNTVSVNLQPDEEDVEVLMADLVEDDLLEMMKDGAGHFYRPDYNFNNIPGWSVEQGYQIKMRAAAQLTLEGWTVVRDEPIFLEEGWQLVSYYPTFPIEATLALSGIEDHLIICKDGFGNFYIPAWDYSNIGDMLQGQGYYMNVDADVELVYVFEREDAIPGNEVHCQASVYVEQGLLAVHPLTGTNMSLLALADPSLTGEVAVYASDKLVGSGVLQDGYCGIAVWGDDPMTDEKDGAVKTDPLEIKFLNNGILHSIDYTMLSGKDIFSQDGLSVIRLATPVETPFTFGITYAYPNPFNSQMQVGYNLPEAGNIRLNVYDLTGRLVSELSNDHHPAGIHTSIFDGSNLSSGIYLIQLEASGHIYQKKITLMK
ncbi:MAG: T9SS type A sorting domain-containing protein [Candidatus Hatepunaea meridiana]|nr:T9SS type A sorting domain-containing protein [Candidatus Hatepunaea meridiana]